jgi:pantoate--beta-alanine ligase
LAHQQCDFVVVSLATNEGQFATLEEYQMFPRHPAEDLERLQECGLVNVVLLPTVEELFKHGSQHGARVYLQSDIVPFDYVNTDILEGECTMLAKLINLVAPTRVYLGQKDLVRARVLQRMIDDMLYPIDVITIPTVRADDGAAFDARLLRLSSSQREAVAAVYRALRTMISAYLGDIFQAEVLVEQGRATLAAVGLKVNWVRVAHPFGFQDLHEIDPAVGAVAFISITIGGVTHTDNAILAPLIPAHEQTLWSLVRSVGKSDNKPQS